MHASHRHWGIGDGKVWLALDYRLYELVVMMSLERPLQNMISLQSGDLYVMELRTLLYMHS